LSKDTIKCSCGKSHIILDDDDMNLTCGVKGLISADNVTLVKGKVSCVMCLKEIYIQHDGD
jgi:hypothetical protein